MFRPLIRKNSFFSAFLLFPAFCIFFACNHTPKTLKVQELVKDPKTINQHVQENIESFLAIASDHDGAVDKNLRLVFYKVTDAYYHINDYQPFWSDAGKWKPSIDSLLSYLSVSQRDGLFKDDYQFLKIQELKIKLDKDSIARTDAILWTKADILLTDAFMHITGDLSQGRLQPDSNSWRNDTAKYSRYFFTVLDHFKKTTKISEIFDSLQPSHTPYRDLRSSLKSFLENMDTGRYTYVDQNFKDGNKDDSLRFFSNLRLRLNESRLVSIPVNVMPDSFTLAVAIKKIQKKNKLTEDGKISAEFIRFLNTTDVEKYNRIAVTLDRYKQLPVKMPEKYIWVNLPGYYLQLHDSDSVVITSKIICGKTTTQTPFIASAVSDIVIYPTWTVPESIIKKEMLPALKKNAGYLAKKGLDLYDFKGDKVDPSTVNWSKFSKGIPYKIRQGSGDENALGVIKFNFSNPYAVYLHDTNQRYLFKKNMRALSHGCVRVQDWEKLAFFIIRNDSINILPDTLKYNTDSVINWIANKEKHRISVKFPIPLFIRYFTCEANNGVIKFYDDIYGDDRRMKEKYFSRN